MVSGMRGCSEFDARVAREIVLGEEEAGEIFF
jgi:hypothetical protein